MINLNVQGKRWIELGCGANPHPECAVHVDCRSVPGVTDFVVDLNEPLPIQDQDFEGVFSQFAYEHVSWRKARQLFKETFRVLKPGGRGVLVLPNTEAQVKFALARGWQKRPPRDGMKNFEEASCVLFGDNDYPENTHRSFYSPEYVTDLLQDAGFIDILIAPFGEAATDMIVEFFRPLVVSPSDVIHAKKEEVEQKNSTSPVALEQTIREVNAAIAKTYAPEPSPPAETAREAPPTAKLTLTPIGTPEAPGDGVKAAEAPPEGPLMASSSDRAAMFDRHYFEGTGKWGGYEGGGYRDYPSHEITAKIILDRKPASVLELGCARGHVLKRIQDAGVQGAGIEISKHCYLTRVCNGIVLHDLCVAPWPLKGRPEYIGNILDQYDLCFSVGVLDHVPSEYLPHVLKEMARVSLRQVHGITFTPNNDRTRVTVRPKEWWVDQFRRYYAPHSKDGLSAVEIVEKDSLESGSVAKEVLEGDGALKVNVGSFSTMFLRGWTNVDLYGDELSQFAGAMGYKYQRVDVRGGLPFPTGGVSLIFMSHVLEHLTYAEGAKALREFRRVIRMDGAVRILVPDAKLLTSLYVLPPGTGLLPKDGLRLEDFDEMNEECAKAPTLAGKFHAMLYSGGHLATYDRDTLCSMLEEAGFKALPARFREPGGVPGHVVTDGQKQIIKECLDMAPEISLVVDAVPKVL